MKLAHVVEQVFQLKVRILCAQYACQEYKVFLSTEIGDSLLISPRKHMLWYY